MKFNFIYLPEANNIHTITSHRLWSYIIKQGDTVIDATCGNGHDSLYLAKQTLSKTSGQLYCIDIQKEAISSTKSRLEKFGYNSIDYPNRIQYIQKSHESFPSSIAPRSVSCITYNLGYLPWSVDKSFITKPSTTLLSLQAATKLLKLGGMMSVMAYVGHQGGAEETNTVIQFMENLSSISSSSTSSSNIKNINNSNTHNSNDSTSNNNNNIDCTRNTIQNNSNNLISTDNIDWLLNMYALENKPSAPVLLTAIARDPTNTTNNMFDSEVWKYPNINLFP